ncbi:TadE/TadG family type IV pilus assembly protein [Belnapia rosea]|uniref:TadE/TadG family type IV pilus assembly protein n=1 Tax=Belnapia rosea TaxID=938405 RepID=UPI00087F9882|nr:TadE/TadG family type IV pilus assembly protein [Belnapia rosea]SDB74469.1 TadE-like protein [Belnapia rosea]
MPWSASARPGAARRRRAQAGATSLEFALVGSILLSLLLGSIEMSRYMFTVELVRVAAAEAVRLTTLRGSQNLNAGTAACSGLSGNLSGAGHRTPFLDANELEVTMSGCTTAGGITTVSIAVEYPFSFAVPFFGTTSRPVSETARAVFH